SIKESTSPHNPHTAPLRLLASSYISRRREEPDAEAEELGDGDPRHGAGGSRKRDPVASRYCFSSKASGERSPSSQASPWDVAPGGPGRPPKAVAAKLARKK